MTECAKCGAKLDGKPHITCGRCYSTFCIKCGDTDKCPACGWKG